MKSKCAQNEANEHGHISTDESDRGSVSGIAKGSDCNGGNTTELHVAVETMSKPVASPPQTKQQRYTSIHEKRPWETNALLKFYGESSYTHKVSTILLVMIGNSDR